MNQPTYIRPVPPPMTEAEWQERMLNNTRRTATATVFVAWVVGVGVVISVILGIIVGVQLAKIGNSVTTTGGSTSTLCQSQGGPIAGC